MNYPGTCVCSYLIKLISLRVLITTELTVTGAWGRTKLSSSALLCELQRICSQSSAKVSSWNHMIEPTPQVSLLIRCHQHHVGKTTLWFAVALNPFSTAHNCRSQQALVSSGESLQQWILPGAGHPRKSDLSGQAEGWECLWERLPTPSTLLGGSETPTGRAVLTLSP